jgi:hypothetical protein
MADCDLAGNVSFDGSFLSVPGQGGERVCSKLRRLADLLSPRGISPSRSHVYLRVGILEVKPDNPIRRSEKNAVRLVSVH